MRALSFLEGPAKPRSRARPFGRAEDLPSVLFRERARADRIHGGFCVVLFGLRGGQESAGFVASVGAAVRVRARETDEVTLVGDSFACAILPDTPAAGGHRFAETVSASLNGQADRMVFTVLSYPSARPDQSGTAGAADGAPRDASSAPDCGRVTSKAHGGCLACGDLDGASVAHAIDERRECEAAQLLSAFLRHVASVAALPSVEYGTASLDVVFAAPMPWWKRTMDVVVAVLALLCLSPLLLAIAAVLCVTSGRPVIFKQRRAGLMGRPFDIYKFRTMVVDAERHQGALRERNEQDGPAFKITDDPRITRLGRFLRKMSLDELPQLWNVLKGDMSLVGPRPLPCGEASACTQWQRRRLDVTPGITCIWQVKGRSRVSFPEWMRMDLTYVRSRRLVRDVYLLVLTIPAVLLRRGAK